MKRITSIVALTLALVAAVTAGDRFGRRAGALGAGGLVTPAQIWRVSSLTMDQRKRLYDEISSLRGGGRAGMRDALARVESVASAAQLDEARRNPREPLVAEELLYYPAMSLPNLDATRREKIRAVFEPAISAARASGGDVRGRHARPEKGGEAVSAATEAKRGELRARRVALFEVLDALLTPDQVIAVKQFLPEAARNAGMRERVVYRLPSLTLEQEARARAIFAALDDETAADRARLKAMEKGRSSERREVAQKIAAREKAAHEELAKVLTAEQMKELASQKPGPPRPLVFKPEAVRAIDDLTPEQRRRIVEAYRDFATSTKDERASAKELGKQAKGGDLQSPEMAGVRDQLRQAARVLDVERDRVTRTIADTLTPAQLAKLVASADAPKPQKP